MFGQCVMIVMCQFDQVKFCSYCENICWMMNDVLFVIFNVFGDNNNYKIVGGCNGEYEDCFEVNC